MSTWGRFSVTHFCSKKWVTEKRLQVLIHSVSASYTADYERILSSDACHSFRLSFVYRRFWKNLIFRRLSFIPTRFHIPRVLNSSCFPAPFTHSGTAIHTAGFEFILFSCAIHTIRHSYTYRGFWIYLVFQRHSHNPAQLYIPRVLNSSCFPTPLTHFGTAIHTADFEFIWFSDAGLPLRHSFTYRRF